MLQINTNKLTKVEIDAFDILLEPIGEIKKVIAEHEGIRMDAIHFIKVDN